MLVRAPAVVVAAAEKGLACPPKRPKFPSALPQRCHPVLVAVVEHRLPFADGVRGHRSERRPSGWVRRTAASRMTAAVNMPGMREEIVQWSGLDGVANQTGEAERFEGQEEGHTWKGESGRQGLGWRSHCGRTDDMR